MPTNTSLSPITAGAIPIDPKAGHTKQIHIPFPGTSNLTVGINPINYKAKTGSQIFFKEIVGAKKGYQLNIKWNGHSKSIEFDWDIRRAYTDLDISKFTGSSSQSGAVKYFRYLGRAFVVASAASEIYTIATASKPLEVALQKVSAWALAWAGCKAAGTLGATVAPKHPVAIAVFGAGGCVLGASAGYDAGEKLGKEVYQWANDTLFSSVKLSSRPPSR